MKSRFYISIILLILLISAFFRLGYPDSTLFGGDEDSIACKIFYFVNNHKFPPLLTKSHGVYTIAVFDIFLYALMHYVHDPRFITLIAVGIPSAIAVILCFLFCCRFIGKNTALLATALFGFSGWAIHYARNLWGVDTLQFISLLIFYIIGLGISKKKIWLTILSVLMLPFLPNLHLTAFSLFASVFIILTIYYFRRNIRFFIILTIFTVAILIISFPILNIERKIVENKFSFKALLTSINLIVKGDWYYTYFNILPRYPFTEELCEIFIRVLFIFGIVYLIKRSIYDLRRNYFSGYLIVGIWYFTFVAMFGGTNLTTHGHYFMTVLPSLFIIVSIGFFAIVDYICGRQKIDNWEIMLLSLIFLFWSPLITILFIFFTGLIRKLPRNIIVGSLYSFMTFLVIFNAFLNIQLFRDIEKIGFAPYRDGAILGYKIDAVKYIVDDAELNYKQTGYKSYYSLEGDEGYNYLFGYLTAQKDSFLFNEKIPEGFHYRVICDINKLKKPEESDNYICHKRIGPVLVITEKIDEA